jgi:N-acylneuraminate cytidylyltransferase
MDVKLLEHISKGKIYAIIPARGGSKGIPGKNISLWNQHPLIAYSIAACYLSNCIERVIVSTDSREIADISLKYGAEVPFLRPAEYARDDSPDIEFVIHAINWFYENEGTIPEYFAHVRPTTPIRDVGIIDDAILTIMRDNEATSLRSGFICAHSPYKWLKKGKNEKYASPLFGGKSCDEINLPRQEFPEVYVPNSYIDVLKSEFIVKSDLMHGDKMIAYETKIVPDIDTPDDLQGLYSYQGHKNQVAILMDYLNSKTG